jgi:hypothetical protein
MSNIVEAGKVAEPVANNIFSPAGKLAGARRDNPAPVDSGTTAQVDSCRPLWKRYDIPALLRVRRLSRSSNSTAGIAYSAVDCCWHSRDE